MSDKAGVDDILEADYLRDPYTIIMPVLERVRGLGDRCWRVPHDGPLEHRRALELIGRYFRRELHFDFQPYSATDEAGTHEGWLIFDPRSLYADGGVRPVGGGGFDHHHGGWWLEWVWIHPYSRRRGLLAGLWPIFGERYGDFGVSSPLSDAMEAFLRFRGHPAVPDWVQR